MFFKLQLLQYVFQRVNTRAQTWKEPCYNKILDAALNYTCRLITGCLMVTLIHKLHIFGIALPQIRKAVARDTGRTKLQHDGRHPLYGHQPPRSKPEITYQFFKSLNRDNGHTGTGTTTTMAKYIRCWKI